MTTQHQSNYDKMVVEARKLFLQHDQQMMIDRFHLEWDDRWIYIRFFNRLHRIDRQTGAVEWSEDDFATVEAAGYNAVMTIYDVLCRAGDDSSLSGEWTNVANLSAIKGGSLQKGGGFFEGAGAAFAGKTQAFALACATVGGQPQPKGDAASAVPMFDFLPVLLQFWDEDEDFPASLEIFVDKNTLSFMYYETLMFAISEMLIRLEAIVEAQ